MGLQSLANAVNTPANTASRSKSAGVLKQYFGVPMKKRKKTASFGIKKVPLKSSNMSNIKKMMK